MYRNRIPTLTRDPSVIHFMIFLCQKCKRRIPSSTRDDALIHFTILLYIFTAIFLILPSKSTLPCQYIINVAAVIHFIKID